MEPLADCRHNQLSRYNNICHRWQLSLELQFKLKHHSSLYFRDPMKQIFGLQVNSIQNLFLTCAGFFLLLYLLATLIEKKPTWFLSKTLRDAYALEDRFQKLVASRRDILHHYYWARSEQDHKKMREMDKDLTRIDGQIQQLREEYKKKKTGLNKIIQKLF